MSKETLEWLNSNVLVGFTDERGNAWHYQEGATNHYPQGIPMDEVKTRLFNFEQEIETLYILRRDKYVPVNRWIAVGDPKDNTGDVLGIHSEGYGLHTYEDSLFRPVREVISDGEVQIGSAGLLRNRSVAWLQIERPENVVVAGDVSFRPHILLSTSLDGSYRTQVNNSVTNTVCDNTMAVARGEGVVYAEKHTSQSGTRIPDMAGVIAALMTTQDAFTTEVEDLLAEKVDGKRWGDFVAAYVPIVQDDSKVAVTRAERKREILSQLWTNDIRVQPWQGSAWGVVQAVNTYEQHMSQLRGVPRVERNMLRAIRGDWATVDAGTLQVLSSV